MKIFQKGFNYSQDGPGNRLVFHLQGCNMRCPWCANPEGFERDGALMTDEKWLMPELCPHGAVEGLTLNRTVCRECTGRECIHVYKGKGIYASCEEVDTEEVIREALSARMMYYDGGGVTFTGGECTLQFDELLTVLKTLKRHGIHTAIESNAAHPRLQELFPYVDCLMADCKLINDEKHRKLTGISNEMILQNIRKAARMHSWVHVRVPLVGGVNNSEKEIGELIAFFQSLPQENMTFEALKYHEYGKKKWRQCGWDYPMDEKAKITADEFRAFRDRIKSAGLKYKRT